MKAVIQRVSQARVEVDAMKVGEIQTGVLVLLGVQHGDTEQDARYLADKTVGLRIFPDQAGKMNLSVKEVGGGLLVVSQFTLLGDCRKGKRPSFVQAAAPDVAQQLYETFVAMARHHGLPVETGVFQADMQVSLCNSGPVTLLLDSRAAKI